MRASAADRPAAPKDGPWGQTKRTTGVVHVAGSCGSTPRAQLVLQQDHTVSDDVGGNGASRDEEAVSEELLGVDQRPLSWPGRPVPRAPSFRSMRSRIFRIARPTMRTSLKAF